MRRTLSCVLMMTLLLCGCKAGGGQESAEGLAARIRSEYLGLAGWAARADLTADYGQRVYEFSLDARWEKDGETVLTVTAPELIAGITARIGPKEAYLEYDGASLSTGALTGDGLTPLEAVPFLMEELTRGYMARCAFEGEGEECRLRVEYRDADAPLGQGAGCTAWFCPDTHDLLGAELSWDGAVVLTARLTDFTKERTGDGTGDNADLG